ncbi:hypothetical protein I7I48_09143 [Histoplasma ohiense]|nr:hypothetical protein I7I48_09143 [Histoplasma ohiense (nom. inval.)]
MRPRVPCMQLTPLATMYQTCIQGRGTRDNCFFFFFLFFLFVSFDGGLYLQLKCMRINHQGE